MTLLRFQRLGIVLLAFLACELYAQAPSVISIEKYRGHRQTSDTNLRSAGALFGAYVYFLDSAPPSGVSIALLGPTGTTSTLRLAPDGTYYYEREFDDFDSLERIYPNGNYTIAVTAGGRTTSIPFAVAINPPPDPTRLSNFDALQAWSKPEPTIQWQQIPFSPSPEFLKVSVHQRDGTTVAESASADLARATSFPVRNAPFFEDLEGLLLYLRYAIGVANNGVTQIATGSGFGLFFKMRRVKPLPVITRQPQSVVTRIGSTVALNISVTNNEAARFRLLKGSSVISSAPNTVVDGFPSSTAAFNLPIRGTDDAGVYTIEVTNGSDIVPSKPVQIAIMPQLEITTLAGASERGAANGVGADARFNGLSGIVVLPNGDVLVSDTDNHVLRRITPGGVVTTFAGTFGQPGAVNGDLATARFNLPAALAIDGAGNVFVADRGNYVIRKITPAGIVSTHAGKFGQQLLVDGPPASALLFTFSGLAVDASGNLYSSDPTALVIRKIQPDGSISTFSGLSRVGVGGIPGNEQVDGDSRTARYYSPRGLAFDAAGNLYVGDVFSMRRITPAGIVTTISSNSGYPISVNTNYGDGIAPSIDDRTGAAEHIALTREGTFYFTAEGLGIRRMTAGAEAVTMAGRSGSLGDSGTADGIGPRAGFRGLTGIAVDPNGVVYALDGGTRVRRGVLTLSSGNPMIAFEGRPQSQVVARGSSVAFNASATGPALSYQWFKDGVGLGGATESTLWLKTTADRDAGTYSVLVGNGVGSITSSPMPLTLTTSPDVGRFVNLSVRSRAGAEENLLVGFVVGASAAGTRNLLLRGIGPGLANFGVTDVLSDPRLTLMRDSTTITTNDDWGGGAALASAFAAAGAFPLASGSLDSVLMYSAGPSAYTLQLTGAGTKSGAALVEVYDQGTVPTAGVPRLVNLSTRTTIGAGAGSLVAGFVIGGSTSRSFLVRAVGPSLPLQGRVDNTQLRIYSGSALLASNDNWGRSLTLTEAFRAAGAFAIFGTDAALVLTLAPGAYTAEMRSEGEAGIALLELYELP